MIAGFFGNLFDGQGMNFLRASDPEDPSDGRIISVRRTASGVSVDHFSALNYSAFYSGVRAYTDALSGLPWHVRRRLPGGGSDVVDSHTDSLLHRQPNPEMSAFQFRELLIQWSICWGNGYAEIERSVDGRPLWLWPIPPDRVTPRRTAAGALVYEVHNPHGDNEFIPAADMFHLRGMGFDGVVGYSVVTLAAQSIGLGLAMERFGSTFFGNGAQFGGVIELPGKMTPTAQENLRDSIEAVHRGSDKAHRLFVLEQGGTYKETGVPPEAAQFLESRKFSVNEMARWLRLPPHKLMELDRATFSNIEQQEIQCVTEAYLPVAIRLEQEANLKLLGGRQQSRSLFTKVNLNSLMRGDSKSRAEFYRMLLDRGVFSINDVLELEDRNPIGPDGDKRFVPLNMQLLEKAGEEPEPPAEPVVIPESEEEEEERSEEEESPPALSAVRSVPKQSAQLRVLETALARALRREGLAATEAAKKHAGDEEAFAVWVAEFSENHAVYLTREIRLPLEALAEWCGNPELNGALDTLQRLFVERHLGEMQRFLMDAFRSGTMEESAKFRSEQASCDLAIELAQQVTRACVFQATG